MKHHALFPTIVSGCEINLTSETKDLYMRTLVKRFEKHGFSDESTGDVDLHLIPELQSLYDSIIEKVQEHFNGLLVDPNDFDFYITKSWMNVVRNKETPLHSHPDAHFSFSYYLNIPDDYTQNFACVIDDHPSDPYPGFIKFNRFDQSLENCTEVVFENKEGEILVFPSHLTHKTVIIEDYDSAESDDSVKSLQDLYHRRVCIAGDVMTTHKEKVSKSIGLQPVKNWKKFK